MSGCLQSCLTSRTLFLHSCSISTSSKAKEANRASAVEVQTPWAVLPHMCVCVWGQATSLPCHRNNTCKGDATCVCVYYCRVHVFQEPWITTAHEVINTQLKKKRNTEKWHRLKVLTHQQAERNLQHGTVRIKRSGLDLPKWKPNPQCSGVFWEGVPIMGGSVQLGKC